MTEPWMETVRAELPPYRRMPEGLSELDQARWLVQKCEGSNGVQWHDDWAEAETIMCLSCGHTAKFRVRMSDRPKWGRVIPHRRDGRPTR